MKITYDIAHAAGWDAGNKSMRERGLSRWDEEARQAAAREFNRLLPLSLHLKISGG